MKYFSGDFVALYNTAMEQYTEEQAKIDKRFGAIIDELIERESLRLETTIPKPFYPGDFIETPDGRIGKVVDCPISVNLKSDDYLTDNTGPTSYLPLKTEVDEVVATMEGMIRKVIVEFAASELEKDWGNETVIRSFYPDEISSIDKK